MHTIDSSERALTVIARTPDGTLTLHCDTRSATFTLRSEVEAAHPLAGISFNSAVLLSFLQRRGLTFERGLEIRKPGRGPHIAVLRETGSPVVGICLPPATFDAARFYIADLPDVPRFALKDELRPNLIYLIGVGRMKR
jgi:hypothetical protein